MSILLMSIAGASGTCVCSCVNCPPADGRAADDTWSEDLSSTKGQTIGFINSKTFYNPYSVSASYCVSGGVDDEATVNGISSTDKTTQGPILTAKAHLFSMSGTVGPNGPLEIKYWNNKEPQTAIHVDIYWTPLR